MSRRTVRGVVSSREASSSPPHWRCDWSSASSRSVRSVVSDMSPVSTHRGQFPSSKRIHIEDRSCPLRLLAFVLSTEPHSEETAMTQLEDRAAAPTADPISVPAPDRPTAGRARTVALCCLLLASFMELMDATVVNVSLPAIEQDLGAGAAAIQWVVAGYPLAYAVGLVLGARLGDRFGRRRLFVTGLALFGMFSLACGMAGDPAQLVAFRLAQGAAAALMVPQVLTNIQIMYSPRERGAAMGLFTGVIGIAAVAGPITGALLTNADLFGLGWRPIFLINVPLAAVAVVAALLLIPESRSDRPSPITVGSSVLLGSAMAALMVPITLGPSRGWPWWGFVVMSLGLVLLAVFVRRQRTESRAGRMPMVPPE